MPQPRNKFEKAIYGQLKRSKVKFGYESSRLPYIIASNYVPDFIIEGREHSIYVECKGYFRPEDKRKLRAVKAQYPEIDLRILFYAANEKNIKWAEKNSFKYAISKIPKDWLT